MNKTYSSTTIHPLVARTGSRNGHLLTQDEADDKLAGAEEKFTDIVNDADAELRAGRRGPGRGIDAEALADTLGVGNHW